MSVLDDFSDIVDEIVLDQIDKSDFEKTKSINKEIKKLTSLSYQKLLSYSKSLQKFENKIYQDIDKNLIIEFSLSSSDDKFKSIINALNKIGVVNSYEVF